MNLNKITTRDFRYPVVGTDPITKGTFLIQWAVMKMFDFDDENYGTTTSLAVGTMVIYSHNDNPLFKIAKETPLRLQGLVAKVDFGVEKRFIKINTIGNYECNEELFPNDIKLNSVVFEILDNLEYLENIEEYRNTNLL